MDLAAEARACERIGGYLDTLGIKTPTIHWELTGIRFNVQERLYGTPASAIEAESTDPRVAAFARQYANAVLRMIILNGEFHGDQQQAQAMQRHGDLSRRRGWWAERPSRNRTAVYCRGRVRSGRRETGSVSWGGRGCQDVVDWGVAG